MTLTFHWFLPTAGDTRSITGGGHLITPGHGIREVGGAAAARRPPDIEYLTQIARSVEQLGFEGMLTPTGSWCEDAWLLTAALTRETERLKYLVAFRPGMMTPTQAALMAATFQRLSRGRLLLNVVTGGESTEQRRYGDWLDHDERYARTDEFLTVVRGAWTGEPFDFEGRYYHVAGAVTPQPPKPLPKLYFGGSSQAAGPVAARHIDVYLTWGERPHQVEEKARWIRKLAAEEGRDIRVGLRVHVITRDTARDAWEEARRHLERMDPAEIARAQETLRATESVSQRRMSALHRGSADDLLIAPNLWAGVGLVRGGAGTALVGSHEEVADRIEEYAAMGIDEFVLSGYPHLEEAYWFGEGVLPVLRARGLAEESWFARAAGA
jgi:alkanesulfonate monooxygenase